MYPPWTTPEDAARILQNGGIVAIPTETVYGLAGNAYDAKALAKIFEAKKRPHFDPLIVHIAALEELSHVASEIPEMAKQLAAADVESHAANENDERAAPHHRRDADGKP